MSAAFLHYAMCIAAGFAAGVLMMHDFTALGLVAGAAPTVSFIVGVLAGRKK